MSAQMWTFTVDLCILCLVFHKKNSLRQSLQLPECRDGAHTDWKELTNANKIIRPAYKYVGHHTEFETMEERSAEKITDEDIKRRAGKV